MTNFDIFDAYRRANTENQADTDYCDIDHLLRFWREEKEKDLLPMFGGQLILERPIEYEKTQNELSNDIAAMLDTSASNISNTKARANQKLFNQYSGDTLYKNMLSINSVFLPKPS